MRTVLYRHYASDAKLLYVGISSQPKIRMRQHENDKDWFRNVRVTTYEWFENRTDALAAERNAIVAEKPLYNQRKGQYRVVRSDGLIHIDEAADLLGLKVGQLRRDLILGRCSIPHRREQYSTAFSRFVFDPADIMKVR